MSLDIISNLTFNVLCIIIIPHHKSYYITCMHHTILQIILYHMIVLHLCGQLGYICVGGSISMSQEFCVVYFFSYCLTGLILIDYWHESAEWTLDIGLLPKQGINNHVDLNDTYCIYMYTLFVSSIVCAPILYENMFVWYVVLSSYVRYLFILCTLF